MAKTTVIAYCLKCKGPIYGSPDIPGVVPEYTCNCRYYPNVKAVKPIPPSLKEIKEGKFSPKNNGKIKGLYGRIRWGQ